MSLRRVVLPRLAAAIDVVLDVGDATRAMRSASREVSRRLPR